MADLAPFLTRMRPSYRACDGVPRQIEGLVGISENDGVVRRGHSTSIEAWYVVPEEQFQAVSALNKRRGWGLALNEIGDPPAFEPRSDSEVLMLNVVLPGDDREGVVQRTFEELWACVQAPLGSKKVVDEGFRSDPAFLRVSCGEPAVGVSWVVFDPYAFRLSSVKAAGAAALTQDTSLAGLEVLMAAVLFPHWLAQHPRFPAPFPRLGGMELRGDGRWVLSPHLVQRDSPSLLKLGYERTDHVMVSVIPTVRMI